MPKDPESLGSGLGPLLADLIPLLPSGARRAGAAKVMAARVGDDPSFLVNHPIKSQLLALGVGGAVSPFVSHLGMAPRLAASLGPITAVQILRHLELKKIQENYDTKKRKRLRDLDREQLFDNGVTGLGGSSRLGAVSAYETMRKRKYEGFGSLAEAGDAMHLAANAVHPLLGLSIVPVNSHIDNAEAARMLRKSADFSDQRNSPTIPLYLAAAALASAGLGAARHWAHTEDNNTPALGPGKWRGMIGDVSGSAPLMYGTEGVDNAFFYKPRSEMAAQQFLQEVGDAGLHDYNGVLAKGESIIGSNRNKLKQLLQHGVIVADNDAGAPTIAHEAGHAKIEANPGVLRFMQRHLYPHSRWLAPMAGAGSMAAGLASGSALKGALLGTGIGALANVGMVGSEMGASYHALKHLKGLGDGSLGVEGRKDLMSALSTYLAATVLPSTLAGAAGGWISGRRRKRRGEEEQEKSSIEKVAVAGKAVDAAKDFGKWWGRAPWISFPWMKNYAEYNKLMATEGGSNVMIPRMAFQAKGMIGPMGALTIGSDAASRLSGYGDIPYGWGSHMPWSRWYGKDKKERARDVLNDAIKEERQEAADRLREVVSDVLSRFDGGAHEKVAAADPAKLWQVLSRARKIKSSLGADAADRHTIEHLGSVYRSAQGRFFKHPDVAALGVRKGMRADKIADLRKGLKETHPAEIPKPPVQQTFDFFKDAAHPDLPALQQAKKHSDSKDYRQKGLMLRALMQAHPEDWKIDSDDGKGIVGVTHIPTGFRLHTKKSQVTPALQLAQ